MGAKKERKLSKKETERAARMEEITEELQAKGYRRTDQVISILFANIMAIVLCVPFVIIFGIWFVLRNGWSEWPGFGEICVLLVVMVALIVVHELIHGMTWGCFAKGGFKSIDFGFQKDTLTPYCTCKDPLTKSQYIAGSIMPCIILGIIPSVAGVLANSLFWLVTGLIMISGAGGDLTIILKMLTYHSAQKEKIIMDHPTECGFIVFEK